MLQGLKARIPKVSASLLQPLACKAPVGFKDCQTLFIFRGMEEGKGRTKDSVDSPPIGTLTEGRWEESSQL